MSISPDQPRPHLPAGILLHGLGSRGSDLEQVAAAVGGRAGLVLTPDLRGHGDAPASDFTALGDFAADIEPLTSAANAVLVAGFSFGAWVALEVWRRVPAAISAIVLVDPPLDHSALFAWARAQTVTSRGAMRKLGELYRTRDLDTAVALMAEHPLTRDLNDRERRANAEALLAADPVTLRSALRLGRPDTATARPAGSKVPLRILYGSRSLVCPPAAAHDLALQLAGEATAYEGGHCAHLEAPAEVGAALREMLEQGL